MVRFRCCEEGGLLKHVRMTLAVVAMVFLGGCATSRSVVIPDAGGVVENPVQGVAIRIDRVDDARQFEPSPKTPDIPSLAGNDTQNAALTSRAIARKRNGFGMALGDVMLPEGQTVSQLVGNAVTLGFRRAGYRVLKPGDPGYEQAIPVTARIGEFWSWFNPGFSSVTITNRASVGLAGALPALSGETTVKSEVSDKLMAVFEDDWTKIVSKGLAELTEKIRVALAR